MDTRGRTFVIRVLPMILVALLSSAQGVIIPQVIASFGLSLSHGGLLVAINGSASVLTMLVTGLLVERLGPMMVLVVSVAAIAAGALATSVASSYALVVLFLWFLSIAASSTAASTNALMAQTGDRRAYYLGMMHATYSLMSIGAPVLAAAVVANARWQGYYWLLLLAALAVGTVLWRFERVSLRQASKSQEAATPVSQLIVGWRWAGPIAPICLGVYFMAGTQASLATWGYSFMATVYQTPHSLAAAATSLLWVGVLAGRVSAIPLSGRYSERVLLVAGSALCLLALGVEWLARAPGVAMAMLVFAGYGVSGAFQLGTSWGAAIMPQRIGIASSLVMASASLGGLILPSMTAIVADHFGFEAFRWLMLAGYLVAASAFWLTPTRLSERWADAVQ